MLISTINNVWDPYGSIVGSDFVPELQESHISINDAELGINKPVGCVLDWDGDYLQSSSLTYAPMTFDTVLGFTGAGSETSQATARRYSKIILSALFTISGATAVIYPLYQSGDGIRILGRALNIVSTSIQNDSGYYLAEFEEIPTNGADLISFIIQSIDSGLVALLVASV